MAAILRVFTLLVKGVCLFFLLCGTGPGVGQAGCLWKCESGLNFACAKPGVFVVPLPLLYGLQQSLQ